MFLFFSFNNVYRYNTRRMVTYVFRAFRNHRVHLRFFLPHSKKIFNITSPRQVFPILVIYFTLRETAIHSHDETVFTRKQQLTTKFIVHP